MMNNQDEQDPNGPNEEPAHNENGEEQHVDAPACPAGSPCIRVIEGLRARLRRLQEQQRQHRTASTFALSRREAACDKKDSEINKLKGSLEIQEKKWEARLAAARARLEEKRQKEVGQSKASYVKLELESSKVIASQKSSFKLQASELRNAIGQLKSARLANTKLVAQKNAADAKITTLSEANEQLRQAASDKEKVLKQLLQRYDAVQKKLVKQNELKVKASVEKEKLKLRKEEVALERLEAGKRKAIELKLIDAKTKKEVQDNRAKCLKAVHRTRALVKGNEHRRSVETSKNRLLQSGVAHHQDGRFPSVGGGPDSISYHQPTPPPLFLRQQTLTQMPMPGLVGHGDVGCHVGSSPAQVARSNTTGITSDNDLDPPGGWERLTDTISGKDAFVHTYTGKVVYDRLECYKKPPPVAPTSAAIMPAETPTQQPAETPTQPGFVTPEIVVSVLPQVVAGRRRRKKIRKINPDNPIDLCSSGSDCSNSGDEESPEIVYGNTEAQRHQDEPDNSMDTQSDSEKTTW